MSPKQQNGKRTRQMLSLEDKVKILDLLESGTSFSEVGRMFDKNESSIRTIKRNENRIRESHALAAGTVFAETRDLALVKSENALTEWLESMSRQDIAITGKGMREKALSLYEHYSPKVYKHKSERAKRQFKASRGWLVQYAKRINLNRFNVTQDLISHDESLASYSESLVKWPERESISFSEKKRECAHVCDDSSLGLSEYDSTVSVKRKSSLCRPRSRQSSVSNNSCTTANTREQKCVNDSRFKQLAAIFEQARVLEDEICEYDCSSESGARIVRRINKALKPLRTIFDAMDDNKQRTRETETSCVITEADSSIVEPDSCTTEPAIEIVIPDISIMEPDVDIVEFPTKRKHKKKKK